jgi:hypothetical protein
MMMKYLNVPKRREFRGILYDVRLKNKQVVCWWRNDSTTGHYV